MKVRPVMKMLVNSYHGILISSLDVRPPQSTASQLGTKVPSPFISERMAESGPYAKPAN